MPLHARTHAPRDASQTKHRRPASPRLRDHTQRDHSATLYMTTCLNLIACSFRYMQIKSSSAFPGNLQTLTLYGHTKTAVPMYQCTNGLLLCNRPLYSSTVIGTLLHLIQRGWAWASCGPGQSPPRCTKCNNPSINGQCTSKQASLFARSINTKI